MAHDGAQGRVAAAKELPEVYAGIIAARDPLKEVLGATLFTLVELRASYVNGCAFCVDLHSRDALGRGEDARRLFALAAWREAPTLFTEAERAALALVDEVTRIGEHGVSDAVYAAVTAHYTDRETAALIVATGWINLLNRIGVATRMHPPARV
ncbi:carboxymuconolactone decarboxylase family protein [Nocardiopsis trehalosi]|jgi:AhpD family alkylhydroperoxidase|uniref:carboxymuconolactone decarboxylase family protein n=1 Tax=Nocardiopsis trehalosi TaxID=109329 RepID=UPI000836B23C|nr:carboxymuconolactone decarboxylase family protein [Nocardiopsis trehalosi]